jgi:ketopantoate hydroxymethyltransferase
MSNRKPITLHRLRELHAAGEKIAMLTCYDAAFARVLDEAGADSLLVGDSLGNVLQGRSSTLGVSIEEMAYHTGCVARGNRTAWIIADLPFGSYQESAEVAMLVLEMVPAALARELTKMLPIPTIGIGAGAGCSGQVLVLYDMLGLTGGEPLRFVRNFLDGSAGIGAAAQIYVADVKAGRFPDDAIHSF